MAKKDCSSLCGARLFVPSTYEEALTYQQKQEFMWDYIQKLEERVKALEDKNAQSAQ